MIKLSDLFKSKKSNTTNIDPKNIYAASVMFFIDHKKNMDVEYFFGDMDQNCVEILGKFLYCMNKGLLLSTIIQDLLQQHQNDPKKITFITSVIQYMDLLYAADQNKDNEPVISPSATFSKNAK